MIQAPVETIPSFQAPPSRGRPARPDAPPQADFSTMVDEGARRPPDSARAGAADLSDRAKTAAPRDEKAKNVARTNDDRPDGPTDAPPPADAAPSAEAAPSAIVEPDATQVDASGSDVTTAKPAPDADALITTIDAPAPDAPAAVVAITPQVAALDVPPSFAPPVATPPAEQSGPLSIATAALAATVATIEAAKPQKPATAATPGRAAAEAFENVDPALAAAFVEATPAAKSASAPDETSTTTPDATQPAATAFAPHIGVEAKAALAAAKTDGTPADTPVIREPHATTPQPNAADVTAQSFTPTLTVATSAAPAPIATAPVSVIASQTAPVPLDGLAIQIAASALGGKTRFDIRLDPAELGRIDVRIDVDRHGNVTSHLTVEKPETLAMLRQDAPQLQRALADAGLQTSDKGMQFSLSDQSSSGQNSNPNGHHDNGRAMHRLVIADDNSSLASAGRSYGRSLASSGGVDIRI